MLDKKYNFASVEEDMKLHWEEQKPYQYDKKDSANTFSIDTPPPTISGNLHMGHIYSYCHTDFIARFNRMMGKNVFYPVGYDNNGLPTERLVEKIHKVKASKIEREEFIKLCFSSIKNSEAEFDNVISRAGLSVDRNFKYHTISKHSIHISQMSFLDLVKKQEVYRAKEAVLWDVIDQTALAAADVEEKEVMSQMHYIIFNTSSENITIATTRPELMPACVALFYHPEDTRYKHLEGGKAVEPMTGKLVPILPDDSVKQDKGTGLVMCCTYGDSLDVYWQKKHKLPVEVIISKYGVLISGPCSGMKIKEARVKSIEILNKKGLVIKSEERMQSVKVAERSGGVLEIIAADQWFIKTIEHKEKLLELVDQISWRPEKMKIRLINWIEGLAWDWCISRQRFFGVSFPVWYSKRPGEEGKILYADLDQLPLDPMTTAPKGYDLSEVEPEMSVMDTWATSAVSPQINSGAINQYLSTKGNMHDDIFPMDLRPQGHEILRTWAFYTILKSYLHEKKLPWKNIMISGWCLAEDKSKMSKSKGNVIEPSKLFDEYGVDSVRYWASNGHLGDDSCLSVDILKQGKKLTAKLWNASKYIAIHKKESYEEINHAIDIWFIGKLNILIEKVQKHFTEYEYSFAKMDMERFFWQDFCDDYIEISKTRAYDESDSSGSKSARATLYTSLEVMLKLFAPIMPYITDYIFMNIFDSKSSLHHRGCWPSPIAINNDENIKEDMSIFIRALYEVRRIKASENLSVKSEIYEVCINSESWSNALIKELKNVCSIRELYFNPGSDIKEFLTYKINK